MSPVWTVLVAVGAATVALKATGPVILGDRQLPRRLLGVVTLLAPALLAALVVTQTAAGNHKLVLDARAPGLVAGAIAVALRAPVLVVVVVAAVTAAVGRALM